MEAIRNTRIYQWIDQMDSETFVTITGRWIILGLSMLIFYYAAPYIAIGCLYGAILLISMVFVFVLSKVLVDRLNE